MVMSNATTKEKDIKEKRMFVGIVWNCAAELKLICTALLFLSSLAIVLQFVPSNLLDSYSWQNQVSSSVNSSSNQQKIRTRDEVLNDGVLKPSWQNQVSSSVNSSSNQQKIRTRDEVLNDGVLKRGFEPYGSAAYNFILMSAYRGGTDTFAVVGLSSKPLHLHGKPTYQCVWIPRENPENQISVSGNKILPDWGYGRIYTVVVVNCTFQTPVGEDGLGGQLIVQAATNDPGLNTTDNILALDETPQNFSKFKSDLDSPQPKYDYLYCGSSLYGNLSPQRVREWLAYHVRLFGDRSHFVIHDAGGVHEGVKEVLKPWMEKGFVTLQDIRDQERFDGYYHNQFLIVNDCLHRYRFETKWMFFFDVDEFIFVQNKNTIKSVLDSLSDSTQLTFEQMTMSNKLCLSQDAPTYRKWGFEKLVYKDVKRGIRRDRKYAIQPRNVFATGVHMSQNTIGKTTHKTEGRIRYFHYHGTIAERREPCRQLINSTSITVDRTPYVIDTTLRDIAGSVKRFELKMIGSRLQRTRQ
ncbi:hypothetical protein ACJIZ3_008572 [Penstemon smallii]|uniref:Glycosyltransferase family 92 protein n=1 Tax=Penstemon smallii TaxID=265156 RepID=A0ABD3TB44_9LAMI